MEKTIIHNYKELRVVSLTVYGNGACEKTNGYIHRTRETINKMACYYPDSSNDLITELAFETKGVGITPKSRLFVASECKISRDTLRNSGYSITRDKNNANVIVVPDVIPCQYYNISGCNLVAMNEKDEILYIVSVNKYGYGHGEDLGDNELQIARSFLESSMKLTVDNTTNTSLKVWFLPKCDEIVNVMTGNKLNVPYVQESKVQITASTKISPETLVLWENIDDENLFVRTICTSDWRSYPITILVLLTGFKKDINWYNPATSDFRRILKDIGYGYNPYYWNEEDRKVGFLNGKTISKKDYEMLQGYIFCRFGIDKNGGFITPAQWDTIPLCVRRLFQRRIAIKPFDLSTTMKCRDLMSVMDK